MKDKASAFNPSNFKLQTSDPQFIKSDAIIIRRFDYSETSSIMSLLTRDHGRMDALAKGARRGRSIFEGEIDLFARGEAVILVRQASLHLLTEFSCRERYLGLRESPQRSTAAHYIASVVGDAYPEGHHQPEIFDLTAQTLARLEHGEVPAVIAFFQVHLLRLSGLMPDLADCVVCGGQTGRRVAYSFARGGAVCGKCHQAGDGATELSGGAISLIKSLARGVAAERTHIPPALAREAIAFLGKLLASAFEREPRMLNSLLRSIQAPKARSKETK